MNYEKYKNSRDLAWQILIESGVNELPTQLSKITKLRRIKAISYGRAGTPIGEGGLCEFSKSTDGFTAKNNDEYIIFYNGKTSTARQRFTIAHELGHIFLGHLKNGEISLINTEPSETDSELEKAANVFASRLLAPAVVLHFAKINTAEKISATCNISMQAAEFRFKRLNLLYNRRKFLTHPLERLVFEQFKMYIIKANPRLQEP